MIGFTKKRLMIWYSCLLHTEWSVVYNLTKEIKTFHFGGEAQKVRKYRVNWWFRETT